MRLFSRALAAAVASMVGCGSPTSTASTDAFAATVKPSPARTGTSASAVGDASRGNTTTADVQAQDPDFHRNATELIASKGYPLEVHKVVTADRYILTVLRINGPKSSAASKRSSSPRPAVLLQHGLLDSCAGWVVNEESEALAFILADRGYDVWLGNNRGNTYSLEHLPDEVGNESLKKDWSPNTDRFWDFTFDEMIRFDVPDVVDYIVNTTGVEKIGYVGHSQGTLQMFGALALSGMAAGSTGDGRDWQEHLRPTEALLKLPQRVAFFNAFGPVTFAANVDSTLLDVLIKLQLDEAYYLLGKQEFLPSSPLLRLIGDAACRAYPPACEDIFFLLCGYDHGLGGNLNATRLPVFTYNTPAGTSVKNMVHWGQLVREGQRMQKLPGGALYFRAYDFGSPEKNVAYYGVYDADRNPFGVQSSDGMPPAYDLRAVFRGVADLGQQEDGNGDVKQGVKRDWARDRIALYAGTNDLLADPKDVLSLVSQLPTETVAGVYSFRDYQHLDFTWGLDAHERVYPTAERFLRSRLDVGKNRNGTHPLMEAPRHSEEHHEIFV